MAKTKLSTFLRSMMLLLFLVSWVSLKTIVKDGNVPVSTNGVKGNVPVSANGVKGKKKG